MGTYILIADVRRTVGIGSSDIDDTDVEAAITEVEDEVPRYFNTVFTPTERIDILDGTGTDRIVLDKNPLLAIRELKIDGTTVSPLYVHAYKESGLIILGSSAEVRSFSTSSPLDISIKYLYGMVEESSTSSTTSAAEAVGTSVSIALASISGFADDDWCEIYGTDGFREVFQIDGTPAAGAIVADQLVYTHASGSTVVKLEINETFNKLMNIIASLQLVLRKVGESATDITGYNLAEFRVQKGEPYTQWRETALQLIRQRDEIYKRFKIRPYIA